MRTRVSPALVLVLALAGAVQGAEVGRFKGTTVSFRVEGGAVKGFALTANALCLIAARGGYEIKVIPLAADARLDGDRPFALSLDDKGTRGSVTGRIIGASAQGQVQGHYTHMIPRFGSIT